MTSYHEYNKIEKGHKLVEITLENSKQSSKTQGESQNSSQTKTDENNQNGQSE